MQKKGWLIVITGPSGVGKKTVWSPLKDKKELNWNFSISMTTRKKRPDETNGVDYFFLTKEEFEQAIANHELLEYATYAGNYYGTPINYVNELRNAGKNVFLEIEPQGGLQIIDYCKKHHDDHLLTIFILPPSLDELKERLTNRKTESDEIIANRLKCAQWEINQAKKYQYQIINEEGNSQKATDRLYQILMQHISQ